MEKVLKYIDEEQKYSTILNVISFDLETTTPNMGADNLLSVVHFIQEKLNSLFFDEKTREHILKIDDTNESQINKRILYLLRKRIKEYENVDKDLLLQFQKQQTITAQSWLKKEVNLYKQDLKKLITLQKKILKSMNKDYSKLLDDNETGLNIEKADNFFEEIKTLIPIIKNYKIKNLENIEKKFYKQKYDRHLQEQISKEISKLLLYSYEKGVLRESAHPFTSTISNMNDVRITTHYHEEDPLNSLYSTIHETGHGLYEQNIDEKLGFTRLLSSGTSMGIHESQSRLYENLIGKNKNFLKIVHDQFSKKYSHFDLTYDEFYQLVNKVVNSPIRINTDELTYPIHILIRYEIEKEIFKNLDEEVDIDNIEKLWNRLYKEYLNIDVSNPFEGFMQDIHWSYALFGYFPSYALGSAYATQMYHVMEKEININSLIENNKFDVILQYLTDKIYKFGKMKDPEEILQNFFNEPFNPKYYTEYLRLKYV